MNTLIRRVGYCAIFSLLSGYSLVRGNGLFKYKSKIWMCACIFEWNDVIICEMFIILTSPKELNKVDKKVKEQKTIKKLIINKYSDTSNYKVYCLHNGIYIWHCYDSI